MELGDWFVGRRSPKYYREQLEKNLIKLKELENRLVPTHQTRKPMDWIRIANKMFTIGISVG